MMAAMTRKKRASYSFSAHSPEKAKLCVSEREGAVTVWRVTRSNGITSFMDGVLEGLSAPTLFLTGELDTSPGVKLQR